MSVGHTILIGHPGVGKTRWARDRFAERQHKYDAASDPHAYRCAGLTGRIQGDREAPRAFRAPHHTCSTVGLVGRLREHVWTPGEFSLAHGGILFLDELPEFSRSAVEALREPLETGEIDLFSNGGRNRLHVPARFTLIASANPCPCGWHGSSDRTCTCSAHAVRRYQARIPAWLRRLCDVREGFRYDG